MHSRLLLIAACFALAISTVSAAETAHIVWSGLVIAENVQQPTPIPEELTPMEQTLKELFGYNQFQVIGQSSKTLKSGEEDWLASSKFFALHVDAQVNIILIISAVTCISIAHVLYYIAIREIGVALSQTLQLLCPAGALGLSALIFHERLTHTQLWSAAILLLGAFLATRVKPIATAETAENI